MTAQHLLLVEEQSMEAFLHCLLPRLLPEGHTFEVHPFRGKRDLRKKLKDVRLCPLATRRISHHRDGRPRQRRLQEAQGGTRSRSDGGETAYALTSQRRPLASSQPYRD